jgi:hypothetical protein
MDDEVSKMTDPGIVQVVSARVTGYSGCLYESSYEGN